MPRSIFVRNCWCSFSKAGSANKRGSTSLWSRARSFFVVMTVYIVEQTAYMLAQGVIENQHRVGLGTTDCLRLLEQIPEPTVVDALLEPGRLREEAGQIGFVSTLKHTPGDVRQTFVV